MVAQLEGGGGEESSVETERRPPSSRKTHAFLTASPLLSSIPISSLVRLGNERVDGVKFLRRTFVQVVLRK